MSETLPTIRPDTSINYDDAKIVHTLKATVAQGLTDEEFLLFAQHCKGTGLNPFKKEVWAIKAGNRLQIMTGLNGFLAIANSHPLFDGMEVEVDDDAKPTKATCRVYRKDRKYPAVGVAIMAEYRKDTPIWKQMPRVMLTKCAKSIALREAFPQELNGIYTDDEMPPQYAAPEPTSGTQADSAQEARDKYVEGLKEKASAKKPGDVIAQSENGSAVVESVTPAHEQLLGFGKHKNERWCDVNVNYLEWLSTQAAGEKANRAVIELERRYADDKMRTKEIVDNDELPF